MSNTQHPFTELKPDLVMDAVESVGYLCDARILELNSYENRVYQIGIEAQQPVIGKFYRPNRWTDEQILEEHTFTMELADNEISVVPPLILQTGKTLEYHAGFRFTLYARRGGRAPDIDDLASLEILGRHIGRIHAFGSQQNFTHRPTISVASYGHASRQFLLENNFIPAELLPAYETVTEQLLAELDTIFNTADTIKHIRLHGDCHMGNVLWRDNLPHFVDFDDARMGPPIQDLWMMLSGDADDQSQQLSAILKGYKDFCAFDHRQIRLIEPLRTLRIMYHASWIARRWQDPAFPRAFPFFDNQRYWADHILELREQWAQLSEPSIQVLS
ncbi:MAG: serine/threonine protein kinase [Pseudomonadales bacterium]|nr:serine/threonine protein kinase [Pseudomonadales bacterium]